MATLDVKITEEEQKLRKSKYKQFINEHWKFFDAIRKRFKAQENKLAIKQFIETIKWYLDVFDVDVVVKKFDVCFGDYEKDGWQYIYNWKEDCFCEMVRQLLDQDELKQKQEKLKQQKEKKDRQKCKQWGLNYEDIGCDFVNTKIEGLRIKWTGIYTKGRKYPIEFYDYREKKDKIMKLDYFKSRYVKEKNSAN